MQSNTVIFETARLVIRKATAAPEDVEFLYFLWNDSRVMVMVGFPKGLRISREEVQKILERAADTEYDRCLLVELKGNGLIIGECKLGAPDEDGVAHTDVKLMPEHWGNAYGKEIKQGLVDYLFTHTDCRAIKATPNQRNLASQKMQEAVGGKRVGEGVHRFPEDKRDWTCDVPHYVYMVFREDWDLQRRP